MTYTSYPRQFNAPLTQDTPNLIEGLITEWSKDGVITVPNSAGKTTRVQTLTPDATTQAISTVTLIEDVTGQTISVVTDATPTATEIVTLLIAAWNANSVLRGLAVPSGTTTFILTARQSGIDIIPFNVIDNGSTTATPVATVTTTAGAGASLIPFGRGITVSNTGAYGLISAALSSTNVFFGITGFTLGEIVSDPYSVSANGYPPNAAMAMLKKGKIAVRVLEAVDPTATVFVNTNAGVDRGRFRATTASGYSQVSSGLQWANVATAGSLVELRVNLP